MSQWKDLPSEILEEIFLKLTTPSTNHRDWANVNNLFYSYGRSSFFRQVNFQFDENNNDNKMNAIIHSPFNPGKWVQEVVLGDNCVPGDWGEKIYNNENYALEQDPLVKLMQLCPNVKRVVVSEDYKKELEEPCLYFYYILEKVNHWELKQIPQPYLENKFEIPFKQVYRFRRTLTDLTISPGNVKKFSPLGEFKQLNSLTLQYVETIFDIQKYLEQLPQLTKLEVKDFDCIEPSIEEEDKISLLLSMAQPHLQLRNLTLINFPPNSAKNFDYIKQIFPKLDTLALQKFHSFGTESAYSTSTLGSFFQFLFTLKEFRLNAVVEYEVQPGWDRLPAEAFILGYTNFIATNAKRVPINSLEISYAKANDEFVEDFTVDLVNGSISINWFTLTDNLIDLVPRLVALSEDVVLRSHYYEIEVSKMINIMPCFQELFRMPALLTKKIKCIEGKLDRYGADQIPDRDIEHHLVSLEFHGVFFPFMDTSLKALSEDTRLTLDKLLFSGDCIFNESRNISCFEITMPNSTVNTLTLSIKSMITKTEVLDLTVRLTNNSIIRKYKWERYYLLKGYEITEIENDNDLDELPETDWVSKYCDLDVSFKSIKNLTINMTQKDGAGQLRISFK